MQDLGPGEGLRVAGASSLLLSETILLIDTVFAPRLLMQTRSELLPDVFKDLDQAHARPRGSLVPSEGVWRGREVG